MSAIVRDPNQVFLPTLQWFRDLQGTRPETGAVLGAVPSRGVDRAPRKSGSGSRAARGDRRSLRQRLSEWEQNQQQRMRTR